MPHTSSGRLRTAKAEDWAQLLRLWALLFDEGGTTCGEPWTGHAREWFTRCVDNTHNARFPVIEVDGKLVATAIGTLEIGVPNPLCVRGRTVRLANVITLPERRGQGHGTMLVLDVVAWARSIAADRVESMVASLTGAWPRSIPNGPQQVMPSRAEAAADFSAPVRAALSDVSVACAEWSG